MLLGWKRKRKNKNWINRNTTTKLKIAIDGWMHMPNICFYVYKQCLTYTERNIKYPMFSFKLCIFVSATRFHLMSWDLLKVLREQKCWQATDVCSFQFANLNNCNCLFNTYMISVDDHFYICLQSVSPRITRRSVIIFPHGMLWVMEDR